MYPNEHEQEPSAQSMTTDNYQPLTTSNVNQDDYRELLESDEPNNAYDLKESSHDVAVMSPSSHAPYVRPATFHKAQGVIDDLQEDEAVDTSRKQGLSDIRGLGGVRQRNRHISRRDSRMLKSSQYGQYLEIPHGKKSIFQTQEQAKQKRLSKIVAWCAVAVFIVIVIVLIRTHLQ